MRIRSPDQSGVMRAVENAWDGVWGITMMLHLLASLLFFIPAAFMLHPLWWVATAPILLTATVLIAYYGKLPVVDAGRSTQYYEAIYTYYPKIMDTDTEEYALPLIREMWDHLDNPVHPTSCKYCEERLATIKELVPRKIMGDTNLDYARSFLEERKKLMLDA